MVKGGGLLGALLGAGGATAYYNGQLDSGSILGYLLSPGSGGGGGRFASQGGRSAELDDLYKLVERLSRDVHRGQGGVTVIHGSNGSSAVFTYGGVILVSTLGVMYIRGWKFSDFLYVTRAGLQKSLSGVSQSVEGLTQRMNSIRQFVATQLDTVKRRQEDTMEAQKQLKDQLQTVGMDVESTRGDVAEVHADLTRMGDNLNTLAEQQSYTSEGIYLLCSVVGDLMKNVNYRGQSTIELERYLKRPASGRLSGLEGLLGGGGEEQAGPRQLQLPSASRMALTASADLDDIDSVDPMDQEYSRPQSAARGAGKPPLAQRSASMRPTLGGGGGPNKAGGGWGTWLARSGSQPLPGQGGGA